MRTSLQLAVISLLLVGGSLKFALETPGQSVPGKRPAEWPRSELSPTSSKEAELEFENLQLLEERLLGSGENAVDDPHQVHREDDPVEGKNPAHGPKADPAPAVAIADLDGLRADYERFLRKYPNHVTGRIAFGNFLFGQGEEERAVKQWERAALLDPKNPDAYNNQAHYYQHRGPVKKAFKLYTKAMTLDRENPMFVRNLATTIYVYRKDAMEYYKLREPEVFAKAIGLYREALALDPTNFSLAVELAESFYPMKPFPTNEALTAWTEALKIAPNELQREKVLLHLARVEINSGMFEEAGKHLQAISHPAHQPSRELLRRNLERKKAQAHH